jgi:hypothetical protein
MLNNQPATVRAEILQRFRSTRERRMTKLPAELNLERWKPFSES